MPEKRKLAELFEEEDKAREMAHRLMRVAQESAAAASRERPQLVAFLRGPMERHMAYEERVVFPRLEQLGLAEEVMVSRKQHDSVREATEALETCANEGEIGQLVFNTARLLLHHTNFEADYIYPELSQSQWLELMRESLK